MSAARELARRVARPLVARVPWLGTVRKCTRMIPPEHRAGWALLPVLGALTGFMEAGAAAALVGLIQAIRDPTRIAELPVFSTIAPHLPWQGRDAMVIELMAMIAVWYVLKNAVQIGAAVVHHKVGARSTAAVTLLLLRGFLLAPYPFHLRRNSSDLVRNTTEIVRLALGGVPVSVLQIVSESCVAMGLAVVLFVAAPGVTLAAAAVFGVLVIVLLRVTRGISARVALGNHELARAMDRTLRHALGGVKEIKALGREDFFIRTYAEQQRVQLDLGYRGVIIGSLPPLVVETTFVCAALFIVALLTLSGRGGGEDLPVLGAFAYAGLRVVPGANRLAWRIDGIRNAKVPVDELYEDYLVATGAPAVDDAAPSAPNEPLREAIVLDRVSYTYPGAAAPALREVTLTIRRGESLGLVGPTGAGKSTLVDVVIGLLEPTEGTVRVDGAALHDASLARRRRVGYVPQAIFLLDDTVARNITLGLPEREVDPERVRAAVRLARLDDLVARLPLGVDTEIGERGVRLSGGERQRIGIARALYHDPEIVVLDEATSALDNSTEAEVSRAIEALEGEKTLVVIAHRLGTVRRCRRLALIVDGRVEAEGTYEELLDRSEVFARMARCEPAAAGAPSAAAPEASVS